MPVSVVFHVCGGLKEVAYGFVNKIKLLAGAFALGAASFAFADPVTVNYDLYANNGSVYQSGALSGSSAAWLSNPVLTSSEHMANYLIRFWIAPLSASETVSWTFDWALAVGGEVTATRRNATIYSANVRTEVSVGTSQAGWTGVGGTEIGTGASSLAVTSETVVAKGTTYVIGDHTSPGNWGTGNAQLANVTDTEMWAYIAGDSNSVTSGGVTASFFSYGNVWAIADVAQPLVPDFGMGGDGGGSPVPEPGSLALLLGAGLMGMARRRRDRLKP